MVLGVQKAPINVAKQTHSYKGQGLPQKPRMVHNQIRLRVLSH